MKVLAGILENISKNETELLSEGLLFEHIIQEAEADTKIQNIAAKIAQKGANPKDLKVQGAMLDQIFAGTTLDNLNIDAAVQDKEPQAKQQQVVTEFEQLNESGHGAVGIIGSAIHALEHSEMVERIVHILEKLIGKKISSSVINGVKTLFHWIMKIVSFIPNQIEKFFTWIGRKSGANAEKSSLFGLSGIVLYIIILFVIAIISFPSLVASVTGGLGIITLIYKLSGLFNSAYQLFTKFKTATEETTDKLISPMDMFNKFESVTGKKISATSLQQINQWWTNLSQEEKNRLQDNFKKVINSPKDKMEYTLERYLMRHHGMPQIKFM